MKIESDVKDDMHFSIVILDGAYGNRSPASRRTGSEFWYRHAPRMQEMYWGESRTVQLILVSTLLDCVLLAPLPTLLGFLQFLFSLFRYQVQ